MAYRISRKKGKYTVESTDGLGSHHKWFHKNRDRIERYMDRNDTNTVEFDSPEHFSYYKEPFTKYKR